MIYFLTKVIMFPFSDIYGLIIITRNILFDYSIIKSKKFNTKIISVGNLIMGGSGKTPHVEFIVKLLLDKNQSISIISRGYKRVTKGLISLSEKDNFMTVGDEPMQYFKKFRGKLDVIVSEDRQKAIQLSEKKNVEYVVMDDAYQQRSIEADCDLLISSIKRPFYDDSLFPVGRLREFRCNANRADVLIFSGCDIGITEMEKRNFESKAKKYLKKNTPILFSCITYDKPKKIFGEKIKKNIVAISSIAYPDDFFKYVDDHFKLIETYNFPDHHKYKDDDITKILKKHGENITILTTEKDAVKLCEYKHLLEGISVYYVPINITFLNKVSILEYLPK